MNIPTKEEWMVVLKQYAAAAGLDKFPAGAPEDQLAAAEERLKINCLRPIGHF